jgi:hypothetical protein
MIAVCGSTHSNWMMPPRQFPAARSDTGGACIILAVIIGN